MLRSPLDSVSSIIFPAQCCVCSRPLLEFTLVPVCPHCWSDLPKQEGRLCSRCGEALGDRAIADAGLSEAEQSLCSACRLASPPFERAVAHGIYAGTLRALVHALKYDRMTPLARRLGKLMSAQVMDLVRGAEAAVLVVPVPLHARKRKERGFNQAELLAQAALRGVRRGRLELAPALLERQRATDSQAGLNPHERRDNLRGAFFVSRPEVVRGRDILLIDDIYTTGATARACSRALQKAGARSVFVATLARAQREDRRPDAAAVLPRVAEVPMEQDVAMWGGAG